MLLLCWPAGLASPVHDHAEASCWMKILSGTMVEHRYAFPGDVDAAMRADLAAAHDNGHLCLTKTTELGPEAAALRADLAAAHDNGHLCLTKTTELGPEAAAYIDDSMGIHRMGNASSSAPAMSLHIYSPPIHRCRVFDEQTCATRQVTIGVANAVHNPFTTADLTLGARFGDALLQSPASPLSEGPATVAALVAALRNTFLHAPPLAAVASLLATARLDAAEWDEYVHFSEQRYVRVLLGFNESFSLVLNCWMPGQTTPLHQHENRDAFIRVVAGQLVLQHYSDDDDDDEQGGGGGDGKPTQRDELAAVAGQLVLQHYSDDDDEQGGGKPTQRDELACGSCRFYSSNSIAAHTLGNETKEAAVSLHVYSPPLLALECSEHQHETVPVVWCSKALAPSTDDDVLARAAAGRVYGSLQTFTAALGRALEQADESGASTCPVQTLLTNFTLSENEVEAHAVSGTSRWLVGFDQRFSLVIRFWERSDEQPSAPHSHGASHAYVKVLHGKFENIVYTDADANEVASSTTYEEGAVFKMNDPSVTHAMRCLCTRSRLGVTLHVFTPP
eukprot:CAMPEP_0168602010 /NCGR_PEP_ID=MMETSP0420-20121227/13784_1 /TAXON_ID=498008 /ORGANISM="Pessonella sp." /LENGTH=561 /DNA_ID=CAMNT_0008640529 /DNA_START=729 /DNA_END=2413 /DNA_ORIENTATION=-